VNLLASPPAPSPSPTRAIAGSSTIEIDLDLDAPVAVAARARAGRDERAAFGSWPAGDSPVASIVRGAAEPSGAGAGAALEGGEGAVSGDGGAPAGVVAAPAARARLSLEALGVGPAGRAATGLHRPGAAVRPSAAARLARSLAQPTAEHDLELGLGPHGPVLTALEQAAREVPTPVNATALFLARVDREGQVVNLELLETTQDYAAWARVADRARGALAGRRLTLSDGANGLSLRIRLEAREQLPSGADPGLAVSAVGIPLKRGKGERSARIDLLKPVLELEMTELPNSSGGEPVRLPTLRAGVNLLELGVDPADLGAPAQRIVRAHVECVELL